ncbi:radical SAM protein [Cystobacter fuscus]
MTALLGPQYRRSQEFLEIDLTWACNLRCLNCNRSVRQAPTSERMSVEQIQAFLDESRSKGLRWRKIRLLGGEPTLHPQFLQIVDLLCAYREEMGGGMDIQVATNGHGATVRAVLARVAGRVTLDNSQKDSEVQPHFGDFNVAPRDLPEFRHAAFRNACYVAEGCGMGLTPYGYYGCAVAGGIDRVLGLDLGRKRLPDPKDGMEDQLEALCARCGRFKEGAFVPRELRTPLMEERMSKSWLQAYDRWRAHRPRLTRYKP